MLDAARAKPDLETSTVVAKAAEEKLRYPDVAPSRARHLCRMPCAYISGSEGGWSCHSPQVASSARIGDRPTRKPKSAAHPARSPEWAI